MPSAISKEKPSLPQWQRPAKTKVDLPWADISIIDISNYHQPGQKAILAEHLRNAVQTTGFFSIVGTGFTEEEVTRQFSIGQAYFNQSAERKNRPELKCDFSKGNYFGYRPSHEKTMMGTDVLDIVESVNIAKFIPELKNEPRDDFFDPWLSEIEDFSKRSLEIASKIFTLFAIILELPEDYFSSRHTYSSKSEDHLRYMTYHPRSPSEDDKVQNTWSRAHTDFGSLTLLWSQNVAGLQIKTQSGDWKYIPPSTTVLSVTSATLCNFGVKATSKARFIGLYDHLVIKLTGID